MKNMKIKNLFKCGITALFLFAGLSHGFELESVSVAEIQNIEIPDFKAPTPVKPAVEEDDTIGVDLGIRIPFKTLKKEFLKFAAENPGDLQLINPAGPLLSKSGNAIKVSNLRLNINGIMAEPVLLLKPYMETKDVMAIKIEKVKFHVLMMPDKSVKAAAAEPEWRIEDTMQTVMDGMIKGIMTSLDKKLKADNSDLKAEDILKMSYNKETWVLRARLSTDLLKRFLPATVGQMHITGFSHDEQALFIKVKTDK